MPRPVQRPEQPAHEVHRRDDGHEHEPEPDEQENLLVEEVDGERALDDVLVDARLVSNLELAQRDARKALRVAPVLAADPIGSDR